MWIVWIAEAMRAVPMCLLMALPHEEGRGQNPMLPKPKRPKDEIGLGKLRTAKKKRNIILSCLSLIHI